MDWEAFYNSFRRPDFIPGYEIENRLGGGAFGDVYKARKTSIGKAYAIKFLKVENDDQRAAVQRELDQVRHFAAIDHPNLVTIEDMGVAMEVPFLIMGYAGEETLAKRFKLDDLLPDEALRVFTQTARGVLALHDRRLVHFDLKPSNIFLRGENARVGDYGLSKLLEGGRTTLSFGRGTPMYMAPEMLRSRADHRADIYSLGVILFESLAGQLPFEPEEHGGLVLREHDDPPEFPSDYPVIARPVTEACLRLDPRSRPQSVSEVLDLLGQTARPGDSVVFQLAPHEARPERARAAALAVGREPTTTAKEVASRAHPPAVPGGRGNGGRSKLLDGAFSIEGAESVTADDIASTTAANSPLEPGTPASKARLLVRELGTRMSMELDDLTPRSLPAPPAPTVIPVPPKVQGGILATLVETTRVGFDVFVAAIVAVTQSIASAFRTITDRLIRSDRGGILGRAVRFAFFLLLMVSIGFGATLLGLFGLFILEHAGPP